MLLETRLWPSGLDIWYITHIAKASVLGGKTAIYTRREECSAMCGMRLKSSAGEKNSGQAIIVDYTYCLYRGDLPSGPPNML